MVIPASFSRPQLLQKSLKQRSGVPHQQHLRQLHHPCYGGQDVGRASWVSFFVSLLGSGAHGAVSI